MGLVDDLLKKYHKETIEELSEEESNTFFKMLDDVKRKVVDIPKYKMYLRELITGVERELVDVPEYEAYFFGVFRRENRQHLFLKARLKNYLFLEAFLLAPDRAKRILDDAMDRVEQSKAMRQNQ